MNTSMNSTSPRFAATLNIKNAGKMPEKLAGEFKRHFEAKSKHIQGSFNVEVIGQSALSVGNTTKQVISIVDKAEDAAIRAINNINRGFIA